VSEQRQDVLRLQPGVIQALQGEFAAALDQLDESLAQLRAHGYLPAPWLGDEASTDVAAHYTRRAMDEPDSSYQSLIKYRDELGRVHDTLGRMEADYLRAESDAARRGRSA
jgi:hypothetical protein